jgi:hypothetical protein
MLFDFAPIPASNPLDPAILALLNEVGPTGRKSKRMTPVALPNPADVPDAELSRRIGRLALHRAGLI